MKIQFAERCGWTAIYLSTRPRTDRASIQFAHIGIDPHNGTRPTLFGSIPYGTAYRPYDKTEWPEMISFRFNLPCISWGFVVRHNYSRTAKAMYRISQRFYCLFDRRF
jgi:hypothetical protein